MSDEKPVDPIAAPLPLDPPARLLVDIKIYPPGHIKGFNVGHMIIYAKKDTAQ